MTKQLTSPPIVSLMDRLKAETRAAHNATEAIPFSTAMMAGTLPKSRYVGQLAALAIVHRALEQALSGSEHPTARAVWSSDLAKLPLLNRDLEYFSVERLEIPSAAMHAAERFAAAIRETAGRDPAALLGTLYVLEGSTLGATILRKPIADAHGLDLDTAHGLAYYTPYGNQVMPHWRQFKQRMNEAVVDIADQQRIVEAAREAFDHIGRILKALSAGVTVAPHDDG